MSDALPIVLYTAPQYGFKERFGDEIGGLLLREDVPVQARAKQNYSSGQLSRFNNESCMVAEVSSRNGGIGSVTAQLAHESGLIEMASLGYERFTHRITVERDWGGSLTGEVFLFTVIPVHAVEQHLQAANDFLAWCQHHPDTVSERFAGNYGDFASVHDALEQVSCSQSKDCNALYGDGYETWDFALAVCLYKTLRQVLEFALSKGNPVVIERWYGFEAL
ncbi:MAG: hypothetical protein AB7S56_07805 [Halothiobacillaceae bacterium]